MPARLASIHSILLFAVIANAQANLYNGTGNATLLCNSTTAKGNASFAHSFQVPYTIANDTGVYGVPDPAWAITVDQDDSQTQTSFWFHTGGQNYSDDLFLTYDVCAWAFWGLSQNTIDLGQEDPGDCSTVFSEKCRNAVLSRAAASATKWTQYASPPPYSNLSAGVLPTICQYILNDLSDSHSNWPEECVQDIGSPGLNIYDTRMTGFNSSILDDPCTIVDTDVNKTTYHRAITDVKSSATTQAYDNAINAVYPVLSVWFTVANVERSECCEPSNATLTCLRAKNINTGSRVSPALPSGTPYRQPSAGLSGGAIAGIVVGSVVGAALIGALIWFFIRRLRKRRTPDAATYPTAETAVEASEQHTWEKEGKGLPGHEASGHPVHEMGSGAAHNEMDGAQVHELGVHAKPVELPGSAVDSGMDKPAE